jgi:hypothetical protein
VDAALEGVFRLADQQQPRRHARRQLRHLRPQHVQVLNFVIRGAAAARR